MNRLLDFLRPFRFLNDVLEVDDEVSISELKLIIISNHVCFINFDVFISSYHHLAAILLFKFVCVLSCIVIYSCLVWILLIDELDGLL